MEFKIGELVEVNDNGFCYVYYKEWAQKNGLSNYKYSVEPSMQVKYKVIARASHTQFRTPILIGIEDDSGDQFIIEEEGIMPATTVKGTKLKIGDKVYVDDPKACYGVGDPVWASKHNLLNWKPGDLPIVGNLYSVAVIDYQACIIIVGLVDNQGGEFISGEYNLVPQSPANPHDVTILGDPDLVFAQNMKTGETYQPSSGPAQTEEDPHKGMIYNPITETWGWL